MRKLAAELPQKRSNFIRRGRQKLKERLDINIREPQAGDTRAQVLADVFGGGVRHLQQRSKDDFVIGTGECMRGEALEDFGAQLVAADGRAAKRRKEPPLDFRDT